MIDVAADLEIEPLLGKLEPDRIQPIVINIAAADDALSSHGGVVRVRGGLSSR